MTSNYAAIIKANLNRLFDENDPDERATALGARHQKGELIFKAVGRACRISRNGIFLDDAEQSGPLGIVVSLYALYAVCDEPVFEPFRSFRELPDSMPYVGAFANRTEQALVPMVNRLADAQEKIVRLLDGHPAPNQIDGDIGFVVRPLPKIALCYLCYTADEDFPAAVTCLYSNNARRYLPTDALADLGEFTSKAIIALK